MWLPLLPQPDSVRNYCFLHSHTGFPFQPMRLPLDADPKVSDLKLLIGYKNGQGATVSVFSTKVKPKLSMGVNIAFLKHLRTGGSADVLMS